MFAKVNVYFKINNKITFISNDLSAATVTVLMRRYGLCYETFKAFVKQHRLEVNRLVSYGVFNRVTGEVSMHRIVSREFTYEIDLNSRVIKGYASGCRAYKRLDLSVSNEMRKAA